MVIRFGQFFQRLYHRFTGCHRLARCLEPDGLLFGIRQSGFGIGNVNNNLNN